MVNKSSASLLYLAKFLKDNNIFGTEIRVLIPICGNLTVHLEACEHGDELSSIAEIVAVSETRYKVYFISQNCASRVFPDFEINDAELLPFFAMLKDIANRLVPFMEGKSISQTNIIIGKDDEVLFNEEMVFNFFGNSSNKELKPIKALMHNFKINEFAKTLRKKMPNGE